MINFAYIDPGLGQMAWQVLLATFLGTLFYLKKTRIWLERVLRRAFRAGRNSGSNPNEQQRLDKAGHRLLLSRRMAVGMLGLILVAATATLGVGRLKAQAKAIANDTLPGLSLAGAANASSAQAFN